MIDIEGYVLAGGLSSRMGRSKANLTLGGRTLAERAIATLSAIAENVVVVGGAQLDDLQIRTIADEPVGSGSRGAIVGIYSALRNAKAEWAAVLACDLPFVTPELMVRLAEIAETSGYAACIIPVQPDERIQPLCGLYRTGGCLREVENLVNGDDWRLQKMVDRLAARRVSFADVADLPGSENFFFNVNSPADFENASDIAARTRSIVE